MRDCIDIFFVCSAHSRAMVYIVGVSNNQAFFDLRYLEKNTFMRNGTSSISSILLQLVNRHSKSLL